MLHNTTIPDSYLESCKPKTIVPKDELMHILDLVEFEYAPMCRYDEFSKISSIIINSIPMFETQTKAILFHDIVELLTIISYVYIDFGHATIAEEIVHYLLYHLYKWLRCKKFKNFEHNDSEKIV